jgi:hypothetical protein
MGSNYSLNGLQQQFSNKFALYQDWKKTTGQNWDFMNYLRVERGEDIQNIFKYMENALEGNIEKGDGKDGNTLSYDRYFNAGDDIFLQTQDGQVIALDTKNGKVSDGPAALKDLQNQLGIGDNTYDNIDFGDNDVVFSEYTFKGLGDGKADKIVTQNGHHKQEELDLLKHPERLQEIADAYNHDHGGSLNSLKTLFGAETDVTRDASGKVLSAANYINDTSMMIVQNGKAFAVKYKDGQIIVDQITTANASKYLNVDKNKTLTGLEYTVDANDKIITHATYLNETGSKPIDNKPPGGWGDPHFHINGQQMFDLQGAGGGSTGEYSLLKDDDVSWTSSFVKAQAGEEGSTVMGAQHLELKTSGGVIAVDYKYDGSYTVKLNGETIKDPSVYGVNIAKTGKAIDIKYKDRLFNFNGANVETNKIAAGSTGILTQLDDLIDGQADKTNLNQFMVNSGAVAIAAPVKITQGDDTNKIAKGFVDTVKQWGIANAKNVMASASPDIENTAGVDYDYNPANDTSRTPQQKAELCARIAYASLKNTTISDAVKTKCVANWIESSSQAMLADIEAKKGDSYASRFVEGHGYSRSQWNEYMGTVVFGSKADINKDGVEDKALDADGDGATDGFDLNNDGILQQSERILKELDEFKTSRSTLSFIG